MGNFVSNYRFRMREIALDSFPMKEGGCKESFTAWRNSPTEMNYVMMMNCMKAHREYYQPVIAPTEASGEKFKKELEAFFMPSKEDLKLPEEEREEELLMRVFDFMKGGPCKEIFGGGL
ncbi:hypothetical protein ARALYDRAFT_903723 [Arabidopsis lyrata subsp. lyrata]|uniref:GCK domain-containing protein n=1 Tax=Arabidopsis lyrata subsp. lyrata TaxID=81972 RepID=D7LK07_ARALL|nr:hypothetical protein ARALYDRAFT_903723 [Arabidopsis lyrata subsp. lyrata]